jgi:hypothetical protein
MKYCNNSVIYKIPNESKISFDRKENNMFKTKLEREIENRKYDPEYIKLKVISEMKFLPDKNEQFDFRGGIGNKIIKQIKNEDGKFFERDNSNEEWKVLNIAKVCRTILDIIKT